MDQTFPAGAEVPASISHRFTVTLTPAEGDPSSTTVVWGATTVDTSQATLAGVPLRGAKWVVSGGCCFPADYHRTATLPVNGQFYAPERYAIDFVGLERRRTASSPAPSTRLSSYGFYGVPWSAPSTGGSRRARSSTISSEQFPGGAGRAISRCGSSAATS